MNDQVRKQVIPHYRAQNRRLMLAEMDDGFITVSDLRDDTHPDDAGYKKMAAVWWAAFQKVEKKGWLAAPQDNGVSDNLTSADWPTSKSR